MFKYCKKCVGIRQFLPRGYDYTGSIDNGKPIPRRCDVCGAEE